MSARPSFIRRRNRNGAGLPRRRVEPEGSADRSYATATGWLTSMGTPTIEPHSVHEPS